MKTLIVDDNKENLYLLETILKGSGYEVTSAANGAEALEKLRAEGFGMIITDILMPVMDGFQLCREVKGDEELKDIPFVFYTATYTDEKDEELALNMGADKFIRKPIEPEEFIKLIQGVIRDAEKGKVEPEKPVLEEEKEVFKLYSERLVEKLEKKMLDLEAEIVQRKRAEERVKHLNLVLRAIRTVNRLIITEKERDRLLKGACEILIKVREYKFAWIGLIEEGHKRVLPAAQTGFEEGYLDSVRITWDDTETGKGPTGTAIKTKQPSLMKNIPEDPRYEPWREEALKRGYLSSAAIPLVHDQKVYGALNVYNSQRDGFNDEEIGLLVEVSSDLAFALHSIELEEKHKRAEEALVDEATRRRILVEQSSDGIVILDQNGKVYEANQRFAEMLGYSPEETAQLHVWDWDTQWTHEQLLEMLGSVDAAGDHFQTYHRRKDGTVYDVEISTNGAIIAGQKLVFCVCRDITERKQAEETLREAHQELGQSEQKYRGLVENMNDGYLVAQNQRVVFANQRATEMVGYAPEDGIGRLFQEFLAPEVVKEVVERYERRLRGETIPQQYETTLLRKDGTKLPVELGIMLMTYEGSPAISILLRNITERKQAEEKARELQALRELDRLRSGLLANVSHELRTPLTSIKGFATTLLRSDVKWSEEEQRDFLQSIDQETERLTRLISDLLDMSRIEAEGLKLEKHNYQISEILDSASSTLASLTEHHQLQVIVPPGLPSVFVDQMRIGQVLTNLVGNATKYSSEGSPITIEAQLAGDQINVSVTDKGEGISAKFLDRVFDRFYQAESIVAGRKSGTGLGLSICRGIVEAHGGRIWVESKPGEGSKFSFSLPVGKGEEEVD